MRGVAAVAGVAAYISYWHAVEVVTHHGEQAVRGHLYPVVIDGIIVAGNPLQISLESFPIPKTTLSTIEAPLNNETRKYAGKPSFDDMTGLPRDGAVFAREIRNVLSVSNAQGHRDTGSVVHVRDQLGELGVRHVNYDDMLPADVREGGVTSAPHDFSCSANLQSDEPVVIGEHGTEKFPITVDPVHGGDGESRVGAFNDPFRPNPIGLDFFHGFFFAFHAFLYSESEEFTPRDR